MKETYRFLLKTDQSLDQAEVLLRRLAPEYHWRGKDHGLIGPYIAGLSDEDVDIHLWLDDKPADLEVDFDGTWPGQPDREKRIQETIEFLTKNVFSHVGELTEVR